MTTALLLGGVLAYCGIACALGCWLRRRARYYRHHRKTLERMDDVMDDGGCWDPGIKRW